nr:immunoglobulin light chain junction region [Macaca mulatta]
CMQGVQRPLTF